MSGIHLPDIGKLGIHIATGIKDKKKVAPSNMAENARLRALSTRLDTEKHERSRVLKKEERRMKRKKHTIDKRWHDIQRNKKEDLYAGVDNNGKGKFPPLISYPKPSDGTQDELSEDTKELDHDSSRNCSPSSAIFPIQDEFRFFENRESRTNEKRKLILPPIGTDAAEGKTKHRKSTPFRKRHRKKSITKSNNSIILERNCQESSEMKNSKLGHGSSIEAKHLTFSIDHEILNSNKLEEKNNVEIKLPCPTLTEEKETVTQTEENEALLKIENGGELGLDETNSSANPFNYLLIEEQRKKALNQNLEDAFRAIKACRYIRTPSRAERENYEDESISSN